MDRKKMLELARNFLDAWNSQDVDRIVGCYTEDLSYCDPNTRGRVTDINAFRHYLAKLFAAWQMRWVLREVFPFGDENGCAFLWHATFKRTGEDKTVEADGMDLVLMRGELIQRNDVYFDRTVLLKT